MITIRNTQKLVKLNLARIEKHAAIILAAAGYADFDLGIWFTSEKMIRYYNQQYRHKDKATDILSFPFYADLKAGEKINAKSDDEKNIGDLIISPKYVLNTLEQWGNPFDERIDILLAHGVAHLLGYDHENDEDYAIMHAFEKKLLKKLL